MAGFGKANGKKYDKVTVSKYGKEYTLKAPEDGNTPCACGSGLSYNKCCQPVHDSYGPAVTPEQVARARFTAVVYGLVPFMMQSTHPDMKDYVAPDTIDNKIGRGKRDIWLKNINIFMGKHDISNFAIEGEETEKDKVTIITIYDQRIRGTKSSQIDQVRQRVQLQQSSSGWQHLSTDDLDSGGAVIAPVVPQKIVKEKAVIVNRCYSLQGKTAKKLAENKKIDFR